MYEGEFKDDLPHGKVREHVCVLGTLLRAIAWSEMVKVTKGVILNAFGVLI